MKRIYIKVEGMTCDHCKSKITKVLETFSNIKSIKFDGHIVEIEYKGKINKEKIVDEIIQIDYYTDLKMISENKSSLKRAMSGFELVKIISIILIISFFLNKIFGFNIFNVIPVIDSNATYVMLLVTGLLTSVHCISMCGAINLIASNSKTKNFKRPILYNLGRLISYTLLGGMVGLLGSVFNVNVYVQGVIILVASIFMFFMGLNMLGLINFSFKFKIPKVFGKLKSKDSFVVGLLNGFMPCGPLQSMQVYALSTGSFAVGALSMFLFALGTIPLMLFVGILSNFLNNKNRQTLNKISVALIILLSLIMFNRGLLGLGIDISNAFKPNYENYLKSELVDDYQIVEFDLTYKGYKDIIIQKDVPARIVINAPDDKLTGCNNGIKINGFGINQDLDYGKNIIEFTPTKTGKFTYTCWMGMLKNNIIVVDDKTLFEGKDVNKQ
ncbi:MAG: sulfite exporter TauE/SafE family protein [Bacilli bacterium]